MSGAGEGRPPWVARVNMDLLVTIWKRTACSSKPIVLISSANLCVPDATVKVSGEPEALTASDQGCILKGPLCPSVISWAERAKSLQKGPLSA